MRTARYRAVPSKIDHRRSISVIGGRLKKKSTVGGRLREKSIVGSQLRKKKERRRGKEKKNEEGKKEYLARLHVVVASGRYFVLNQVPPKLETCAETSIQEAPEKLGTVIGRQSRVDSSQKTPSRSSKKWIANGLLLLGGVVCLSRGRSTIGTQLAVACILKKLMKHRTESCQVESTQFRPNRRKTRRDD
ncbi:hypothetical protein GW17_00007240 [Ensete ventricosum]|nr:hypothetical protein GW17_00007240 [Ensete ventricosum]